MKKLKIIAIMLIITLTLTIIGCSSNEVHDAGARNERKIIDKELQSRIEKREDELKTNIAHFEERIHTFLFEEHHPFSSVTGNVLTKPKTFFEAYSFGYASAPYVLELIRNSDENGLYESVMLATVCFNLQVISEAKEMLERGEIPDHYNTDDDDAFTPKWHAKHFEEFIKTVPPKVDEICDSDIPLEEKYEQLNKLGLLAIPYLIDRIEAGEKEWEVCLAAQFLDRSVEERFELLSKLDFLEQEAREEYYTARTQNENFEFDRYEAKSEYVSSLSSRQIAQVIEDNRVDMEILRKLME